MKRFWTVLLRVLGLLLGFFAIAMSLFNLLVRGFDFSLLSGLFIGSIFIAYALLGNQGLLKSDWLAGFADSVRNKK